MARHLSHQRTITKKSIPSVPSHENSLQMNIRGGAGITPRARPSEFLHRSQKAVILPFVKNVEHLPTISISGDSTVTGIVVTAALIATLRACSRLLYRMRHGSMGRMDGPQVLGPNHQRTGVNGANGTMNVNGTVGEEEELRPHPEWYAARGFQKAVELELEWNAIAGIGTNEHNVWSGTDIRVLDSRDAPVGVQQQLTAGVTKQTASLVSNVVSAVGGLGTVMHNIFNDDDCVESTTELGDDQYEVRHDNINETEPYLDSAERIVNHTDTAEDKAVPASFGMTFLSKSKSLLSTLVTPLTYAASLGTVPLKYAATLPRTAVQRPARSLTNLYHKLPSTNWRHVDYTSRPPRKETNHHNPSNPSEGEEYDYTLAVQRQHARILITPTVSPESEQTTTVSHETSAHVTTYAPRTFADLRSRYGISTAAYEDSVCDPTQTRPLVSFASNSKGAARAGLSFFFTSDGAYMIKTVKRAEVKSFLKMLPKYHAHMKRHSRRTLLTRICGIYTVKLLTKTTETTSTATTTVANNSGDMVSSGEGKQQAEKEEEGTEQTFLVMNSVFPAEGSQFISERYDLKGSTVGRECSIEERKKKGTNAVLKDLDMVNEVEFMRNNLLPLPREADDEKSQSHSSFATTKSYGIDIGPRLKADLLSQLRSDVSLLAECGVMDYSLLVGVVNLEESTYSIKANPFRYILSKKHKKQTGIQGKIIKLISFPMKTIIAPPLYLTSKLYTILGHTMSSILTLPLPYYGAGICGVDGGNLSILHGRRLGKRGVYYLGLIDFLQPWTTKKVLEREMWGLLGYDKSAVSCTDPEEYGERFIEFMSQIMI